MHMKWIILSAACLFALSGCTPASQSPDAIRRDTANATATAARDAKAMIQGVFEGLKTKGPLNINKASKEELQALPGIGSTTADRIIAGRPYSNSDELLKRHLLSKQEYNQIADRIEAR